MGDRGRYEPVRAWYEGREEVLNARPIPKYFTTAAEPVPIRARIVWERSAVELIETEALGWTRHLVHVLVGDRRCRFVAVWLDVSDVERRGPAGRA